MRKRINTQEVFNHLVTGKSISDICEILDVPNVSSHIKIIKEMTGNVHTSSKSLPFILSMKYGKFASTTIPLITPLQIVPSPIVHDELLGLPDWEREQRSKPIQFEKHPHGVVFESEPLAKKELLAPVAQTPPTPLQEDPTRLASVSSSEEPEPKITEEYQPQEVFKTYDVGFAAALLLLDHLCLTVGKAGSTADGKRPRLMFTFNSTYRLKEDKIAYFDGTLELPARKFYQQISTLKHTAFMVPENKTIKYDETLTWSETTIGAAAY